MFNHRTLPNTLMFLLLLVLAISGSAVAHDWADLRLYAVGGSAGYVNSSPFSSIGQNGGSIGLGLHADLGNIAGFALFPNVSYWRRSTTTGQSYYETSTTLQEFCLNADLHYYLNPEANTNYYLGAGVAYSYFKWGDYYSRSASVYWFSRNWNIVEHKLVG
jgi:hypothetical protein